MKLVLIMAGGILLLGCTLIVIDGSEDVKVDVLTENDSGMVKTGKR